MKKLTKSYILVFGVRFPSELIKWATVWFPNDEHFQGLYTFTSYKNFI